MNRDWLNRAGEPISIDECERLFGDRAYRQVALDDIGDARVSTIWLGVGQLPAFGLDDEPSLFETLVRDGPLHDTQWRYATEAEALAGHAAAVRAVMDAQPPPSGTREEPIMLNDDRPNAEPEPGSFDISGLDKAELLAALVNAAGRQSPFARLEQFTHEHAAAIIQDRLGGGTGPDLGWKPNGVFRFEYVAGRPIKCDIGGPTISAYHARLYDRDAGAGAMARVVGELRAAYERRRAEREKRP